MCRKLFYFTCLVLVLMLAMTNITNAQDPNLIGWWKLDDGAGTIVLDSSGQNNHGTINNPNGGLGIDGSAWDTDPEHDTVLSFNGYDTAGTYVSFDLMIPPLTMENGFTWAFWAKQEGTGSGINSIIIGNRYGGSQDPLQFIKFTPTQFEYYSGGYVGNINYENIPENVWVHLAIVKDGETITHYRNGEFEASVTLTAPLDEIPFNLGGGANGERWSGWLSDVYLYTRALKQSEIKLLMEGGGLERRFASKPIPENEEADVHRDVIFVWEPGKFADKHNVYFSTDFQDVNEATTANPLSATVMEGLDTASYDPGRLEFSTTYYWRVDEVNSPSNPGIYKGQVWSFTVEPYAPKVPAESITVTAISNYTDNDPNNTINESGLDPDDMDLHSSSDGDMWMSSGADVNDVWIQYDFDKVYKLHQMLVWNYNERLIFWRAGFKDVTIEYSEDGQSWIELDSVSEFAVAPATEGYKYNTVVEFGGRFAKSVRITAHSNWSDIFVFSNYGLSEIRFTYIPVRARNPQPEVGAADVSVDVELSWRPGREASEHDVYIDTDRQAVTDGTADVDTVNQASYSSSLDAGRIYFWRVDEVNDAEYPAVWEGDIWNFSTQEYILMEGFEDYNNYDQESDEAIWWTWFDGYQIDDNGALITHNLPPFCEEDIVQDGDWAAPLYYDNTGTAGNSDVERIFVSNQNLTSNGADTLRLFYRGRAVTSFEQASDGTIAMSGGGNDIWGRSDEFRFAYKQLTGNGSIIARIDSIENTDIWAKAGVMIRNTIDVEDANSANAMVFLTPADIVSFQHRDEQGANTSRKDSEELTSPYWVKLTRTGNTLTAQRSQDGINWVSITDDPDESVAEVDLDNVVYIGFAITSRDADLAAATFSGVETTGNVSGSWEVANIGDAEMPEGENSLDELYVALEDSNGNRYAVYAPGNAVGSGEWTAFEVPYTDFVGVNMSRIKKLSFGVGNASNSTSGKGLVFIDSIGYGHSLD